MKKLYIPSVVEYRLKEKVTDELAKDLFNVTRNKGTRFQTLNKISNLENSNEYLNLQMDRLRAYAKKGEFSKFDFLARRLLKNSSVFLVYALNHSYPNWTSARLTKVLSLLKTVKQYAEKERNELLYSRVWIDKQPGDFGRPLGVPTMADRIYGHMMTRIMEAYLCGTDQYTSNQHGGVPKRGIVTYLLALAEQLPKNKHIYEFDLKGYFDHIDHKAILEMFESKVITDYLSGCLQSNPSSYKMPPVELDNVEKQVQQAREMVAKYDNILFGVSYDLALEEVVRLEAKAEWIRDELLQLKTKVEKVGLDVASPTDIAAAQAKFAQLNQVYGELNEAQEILDSCEKTRNFEEFTGHSTTEPEREQNRDAWKDLNLEGKGVPQGSNFGPVVASVLLGKVLDREESLLYMDDGLIMLGNKRTTTDRMNRKINKLVNRIGVEINEKKSQLLTNSKLIRHGVKIVGMRFKRTYFKFAEMVISSETRRGIVRPFFPTSDTDLKNLVFELASRGFITASKAKMLKWYLAKDKLLTLSDKHKVELADRIGILGNIVNAAMSPTTTLEEMKDVIEYGVFKAELKMKSSTGSLGERLINLTKALLIEGTESRVHVRPNLYVVRPIANDILLRYLKGDLPLRNLRVQGMRKKFQ